MTIQKVNLLIEQPVEAKVGQKSGNPYYRVKTNIGWFSMFDAALAHAIAPYIGLTCNCDVDIKPSPQDPSKTFKHIKAVNGAATEAGGTPMQMPPAMPMQQTPVVPGIVQAPVMPLPSENQAFQKRVYDNPSANKGTSYYTAYAKDIFVALATSPVDFAEAANKTAQGLMQLATALVNQAKSEFE